MRTLLGVIVGAFVGGHGGRVAGLSTRNNMATWAGGAVLGGILAHRSRKKTNVSGLRKRRRK